MAVGRLSKPRRRTPRGRRAPLLSSENKIGRPRGSRSCLWVVEEGLLGWEGWLDDVDGFPIAAVVLRDHGREFEPHPQPADLEEDVWVVQLRHVEGNPLALLGQRPLRAADKAGALEGV